MARRQYKPDPQQYPFDFESAAAERRAQLMSALTITGLLKLEPLAWFVFNTIENAGGKPMAWKLEAYAKKFGCSASTIRRQLWRLASIGIFEIIERPRERGGQQTNLVSINWVNVHLFAVNRGSVGKLDRATNLVGRPPKLEPRPTKLEGPIKEYPSDLPSELNNTSTTTALPHAPRILRNEEEIFLEGLVKQCKAKFPAKVLPRALEAGLREALEHGLTTDELRDRCAWFHKHFGEWPPEHRPGVFYRGLADATPDMRADVGWPYQR